ncbi:MAG TPA: patatin-like phospholipase family protein, partial [Myxococcota bacterium]|nr:patatin-like phospholipase family protein [Myxococcota bacterium]
TFEDGQRLVAFDRDLLPRVITGASMGAMIAAGVCARTDGELRALFDDPSSIRTWGLQPLAAADGVRAGGLLDPAALLDTIRTNCGGWTFEEAWQRSGRALSISVSPTRRGQRPRLLNHLTAPHVRIAESALASSAIPGLFPPATLVASAPDGADRPYLTTERWIDGSIHGDLPKWRVARLFNVNHFIVSQTNPHVLPFLSDPRRRGLWRAAAGVTGQAVLHQGRIALAAAAHLTADTPLRPWTTLAHALVDQEYRGDIDIHPRFHPRLLRRAFTNATPEELRAYILLGEQATWPHVARIRLQTAVARAFDACLQALGVSD